jgi:hypothetical protein
MTLWQVVSYIGVIGIVIVAFMDPKGFVIFVAKIVISPLFVLLNLFVVAFQRMHIYYFKDGEFKVTLMLVIILKFRTLILYLVKFTTDTFNGLVGEEMIKISAPKTISYVPVDDRASDVKTCFKLKSVPTEKIASYQDQLIVLNKKGTAKGYQLRTTRIRIVRDMLVGWENFGDEDGVPVKFDAENKSYMYDLLGPALQKELEDRFGDGSLAYEVVEAQLEEDKAKAADEDESDDEDSE